jgi:spermidine synthase
MITHLPACSIRRPPKKALVVGGGDGGVLRELSRHKSLEEIHIAEIDGMVIDVSKKYFPQMAVGFSDPRVSVNVCDGIKFVQEAAEGTYDIIVVDSSDPVGPAEVLFQRPFFEAMYRALAPGGIVCTQAESLWYHLEIIKSLASMCRDVFQTDKGGSVQYAFTTIPTYPSGQIGFMICTKAEEGQEPLDPRTPNQAPPADKDDDRYPPLRYYNAEVHMAAFVLPTFGRDALKDSLSF